MQRYFLNLLGDSRRNEQLCHPRELGSGRGFAGMGASRKKSEKVQIRQKVGPIRSRKGPLYRILRFRFAAEGTKLIPVKKLSSYEFHLLK